MTANTVTNSDNMSSYAPTQSLAMAQKRAAMMAQIRQFFAARDVLEVQTPLLSSAGNTDTFLQSVSANLTYQDKRQTYYLHTSPEFAMKRLLASWRVPIYQICPVFRDNEIGSRHNIEFTMLEWYRPQYDLDALADELNDLLSMLYGQTVTMQRYRYVDAFMDTLQIHPLTASAQTLENCAERLGLTGFDFNQAGMDSEDVRQSWLDLLFSHAIEPHLGMAAPTLIIDYPPATAALAKTAKDADGNTVAKRFELYIDGIEIANAYDEPADGKALRQRFERDNALRAQHNLPIMPMDEHLLAACDDLPPCSGIAVGVDRLLMVLAQAKSLQAVISFPSGLA